MLKFLSVSLFVIIFVTGTMQGQMLATEQQTPQVRESRNNLKQVFSKETEKLKSESTAIDTRKMDQARRQTPKKTSFLKSYTFMVIVIVVLMVGLAVVLAKNTRRCVRRSPENCSFTEDTNCECVEYAP